MLQTARATWKWRRPAETAEAAPSLKVEKKGKTSKEKKEARDKATPKAKAKAKAKAKGKAKAVPKATPKAKTKAACKKATEASQSLQRKPARRRALALTSRCPRRTKRSRTVTRLQS